MYITRITRLYFWCFPENSYRLVFYQKSYHKEEEEEVECIPYSKLTMNVAGGSIIDSFTRWIFYYTIAGVLWILSDNLQTSKKSLAVKKLKCSTFKVCNELLFQWCILSTFRIARANQEEVGFIICSKLEMNVAGECIVDASARWVFY